MSQAIIQVLSGYYSLSWTSLISGQIIGTIIGVFIIFNNNAIKYLKLNKRFLARTFSLLRKYKNFPLIAAPSSLIVAASNNCPPLLLGLFFSADTAGLYGLGFRVLQVPLRFIGQSISQVFLGQSAIAKRQGGLHDLALKVFCTLSVFSLYTFVPLYLISAELFTTIFGNEWLLAGVYTQWLMPWLFFGFISTPLSMLVTVLQVQSQEFIFQVIFLFGMVAALATGAILKNPDLSIMSLGAVGGCLLFMKIIWILNLVGCNTKKTLYFLAREVIFCMAAITPLALYIYYTNHHYLQKLIIAGLWSILLHLINHHYRKCYEF
jgi:O-antigen/teichoic acid export membrane protein